LCVQFHYALLEDIKKGGELLNSTKHITTNFKIAQ